MVNQQDFYWRFLGRWIAVMTASILLCRWLEIDQLRGLIILIFAECLALLGFMPRTYLWALRRIAGVIFGLIFLVFLGVMSPSSGTFAFTVGVIVSSICEVSELVTIRYNVFWILFNGLNAIIWFRFAGSMSDTPWYNFAITFSLFGYFLLRGIAIIFLLKSRSETPSPKPLLTSQNLNDHDVF